MSEGMSELEKNILRFEGARDELHAATRDAHAVLKDMKEERRIIERMMHDDVKKRVLERVDTVVRVELEKIQPEVKKQSARIYEKMGQQLDILINLSLGKPLSTKKGKSDLRPVLAEGLRSLIQEILTEEVGTDDVQTQEAEEAGSG